MPSIVQSIRPVFFVPGYGDLASQALSMGKPAMCDRLQSLRLRPRGLSLSQVEVKLKPQNTHKWSCGRVNVPWADWFRARRL